MKLARFVTGIVAAGLMGAALAEDMTHTEIAIVVDDGAGEPLRIELDSAAMGFDLHDLQQGENRSVVDADGRTILITRNADTFTFDVDGRSVDVPITRGEHAVAVAHGGHATGFDIEVMASAEGEGISPMDSTMIVTAEPVDGATQDAIRSLLESAGHGGSVLFIDRKHADGAHGVKVIKKVEVVSD